MSAINPETGMYPGTASEAWCRDEQDALVFLEEAVDHVLSTADDLREDGCPATAERLEKAADLVGVVVGYIKP